MNEDVSDRRLAKNEAIFRELNEQMIDGVDQVNKVATEEGYAPIELDNMQLFHFYCECADKRCEKRVKLGLKKYEAIHADRSMFVVVCGHEIPAIEDIIVTEKEYCVIKKHVEPPEKAEALWPAT